MGLLGCHATGIPWLCGANTANESRSYKRGLAEPEAPSYLNSRLLGYVTIRYIEPSSHYLGNWEP